MKLISQILLGLLALFVTVFILSSLGLFQIEFWSPKYESARREVFEQTPSYVHGKRQYLTRLHSEWQRSDPSHRDAICDLARHEASMLDPQHLTNNLKEWECVR